MLTKTKIALALLLVAGTAGVAMAQDEFSNQVNRYANFANTDVSAAAKRTKFRSAPARLNTPHHRGFGGAPIDRDRLPHAGGVG